MRPFGVLVILVAVASLSQCAPLDRENAIEFQESSDVMMKSGLLRFPPEFYAAAKSSSLNPEDFEKELHELAWTMCDFHRRVKGEMDEFQRLNRGLKHPKSAEYEILLKSNPMEPVYHDTCLQLFQLYPNMDREIQEKEAPVLPQEDDEEN